MKLQMGTFETVTAREEQKVVGGFWYPFKKTIEKIKAAQEARKKQYEELDAKMGR